MSQGISRHVHLHTVRPFRVRTCTGMCAVGAEPARHRPGTELVVVTKACFRRIFLLALSEPKPLRVASAGESAVRPQVAVLIALRV